LDLNVKCNVVVCYSGNIMRDYEFIIILYYNLLTETHHKNKPNNGAYFRLYQKHKTTCII